MSSDGSTDVVTWNGDTTGKFVLFETMAHVNDSVFTLADCANGATVTISGVQEIPITTDMMGAEGDGVLLGEYVFCLGPSISAQLGAQPGIYFLIDPENPEVYVSSLKINGYTFKGKQELKLDPKYLSILEGDTSGAVFTWNGNTNGLPSIEMDGEAAYLVSKDTAWINSVSIDTTNFPPVASGLSIELSSGETVTSVYAIPGSMMGIGDELYYVLVPYGDSTIPFFIVTKDNAVFPTENSDGTAGEIIIPNAGIYVFPALDSMPYIKSLTVNGYTNYSNCKIKPEYLPNGMGGGSSITYGTEELEDGVSPLETGTFYFVYE